MESMEVRAAAAAHGGHVKRSVAVCTAANKLSHVHMLVLSSGRCLPGVTPFPLEGAALVENSDVVGLRAFRFPKISLWHLNFVGSRALGFKKLQSLAHCLDPKWKRFCQQAISRSAHPHVRGEAWEWKRPNDPSAEWVIFQLCNRLVPTVQTVLAPVGDITEQGFKDSGCCDVARSISIFRHVLSRTPGNSSASAVPCRRR